MEDNCFPRQTVQYHGNPNLCPNRNAEEAEWFYEDLQDLLELTLKKDVLFIIGDWNAKIGSQETPGVTGKFGLGVQNEAGQTNRVLPREHTGHSKHPLRTIQEKTLHMDITRWSTLNNQIDYILCSQRYRSSILSAKTRPGAMGPIMNSLLPNSDLN